jgi:translation initiation factor IF-3
VKAYVQFSGREIVFKDQGYKLLAKFTLALSEYGKIELEPKLEGKRMSMIVAPKVVAKK